MKVKVHWIVDGIAVVESETEEEAERWVNENLQDLLNKNPDFKKKLGAKAIQGRAYLPGASE